MTICSTTMMALKKWYLCLVPEIMAVAASLRSHDQNRSLDSLPTLTITGILQLLPLPISLFLPFEPLSSTALQGSCWPHKASFLRSHVAVSSSDLGKEVLMHPAAALQRARQTSSELGARYRRSVGDGEVQGTKGIRMQGGGKSDWDWFRLGLLAAIEPQCAK